MRIRKFNASISVAMALMSSPCLLVAHPAKADGSCKHNMTVTMTGTVGDIYRNKAGTWTIAVAHAVKQCLDAPAVISKTQPPASCSKGAKLAAVIRIDVDDLFETVSQKELIKLNCG